MDGISPKLKKRLKIILIAFIVVLIGFGAYACANKAVDKGSTSEKFVQENKEDDVITVVDYSAKDTRGVEKEREGVTYYNQIGEEWEKAYQAAYDFFDKAFPEWNMVYLPYSVKEVEGEENQYWVRIGDWCVLTKDIAGKQRDLRYCKYGDFTDEEKVDILEKFPKSEFKEIGEDYYECIFKKVD